ncbi:MAG: helix-turn-helix domain-containing protein, partial [Streptosporangiaceae bacterium]
METQRLSVMPGQELRPARPDGGTAMTAAAGAERPGPDPGGMDAVRQARAELGEELVRRREKAGFSQTELARAVGIGRSTLFDSESGRRLGSARLWRRIDEVLGAGGVLQQRRDQIAAMSTAAADAEVRHGRR